MDLDQALKVADSAVASYSEKRGALRILAKYIREYKSLSDSDALHQSPSRQQLVQLSEPFERRPELMQAHNTGESRYERINNATNGTTGRVRGGGMWLLNDFLG